METVGELGTRVKAAARVVAQAGTAQKNEALLAAADALDGASAIVLAANVEDLAAAEAAGSSATVMDRLRLDEARVHAMASGLRDLAGLPDPVGEVTDGWVRPNGLHIRRVRVPLGVVGIIYENRPNVTSDAAGICLKAGNGAFLRGSSGAIRSNAAVAGALRTGIEAAGLPADAVTLVPDTSRVAAVEFMQLRGIIDCLIPRGGAGLIASVLEHATVPFVVDGDGNCHVYIDAAADLDMAEQIVINAKTQRPSVCNAAESLVLHESIAQAMLDRLGGSMPQVELRTDEASYGTEFLDLVMSVVTVADIDAAIAHINRYSTGHTEAIVTADYAAARRFTTEVDAAVVAVNASTRFTDGAEFGFGAEIGNSTQKLHCRGPMGLRELTTLKYIVEGTGQVRV